MNPLRELLGLELPIVQAPMAGAQGSALAIAVSSAGGLGSLPCGILGPDDVRRELAAIRAGTDRPFNVNFFCHTPPTPDPERARRWRELLAPYAGELGIALPDGPPPGPTRAPFGSEALEILAEARPPVVSFHFGLPPEELLAGVRALGARVISSATTVAEARWLQSRGVDAIVAQGLDAGGHRGSFQASDLSGQAGTMALVPQIAKAVRVPVIAAGGIADARGVAAAMALGASGAQVGTSYLLCPEATTAPLAREVLRSDRAGDTAVTNLFTGRPARSIVNRVMRELGALSDAAPAFPLAADAMGPLRAEAERRGSTDFSFVWCGQNPSGCREVAAGRLTRELAGLSS